MQIAQDQDHKLIAERPKAEPVPSPARRLASSKAVRAGSAMAAKLQGILHSPLVLAWALAIGVTAFVAIMMLRPAVRLRVPNKDATAASVVKQTITEPDTPSPEPQSPGTDSQKTTPTEAATKVTDPSVESMAEKPQPDPVESTAPKTPPVDPPGNPAETVVSPAPIPKPALPAVVVVDVESLLKQRLQKFSTSQPVSRAELLELVEEMLGAPIRYNREELGEKNLERPVSLDMESTTVGGVLKALLDPAGWEYVIENNGIKLKPRQVAGNS